MAMDAQTLAEVKRKAALGIAMTNASADKRAVYDQTKLSTNKEIQRKAENGIALTNPNSAANNSMYEGLVAAKNSSTNQIDALNKAKLDQTMAALDKSRNAGLSNLAAEKSAIQPKYYDARNQTAAGSQQQARNFAEFMSARGGTNSGAAAQGELTRGMQLQGNLGALGQQEAAAYGDIERRTSDLQNAYQSDVASAKAGIESERMQAMLTDYYNKQQQELQVAQMMGSYNGKRTLGGQAQDLQSRQANLGAAMDVSNLTGNIVSPQSDWTGLFRQAADGGLGQTLQGQQVASGLMSEQQSRDLATRNAALQEWATTGTATPAVAAALGVPVGTPTSDQSYRQASLTLDQDKFTYAQMADAANAQNNAAQTVSAATAGDMLSQALQKVVGTDSDTGKTKYGVLSDPGKREEAFVNMLNTTGLRGPDVVTALTKAGYSIAEINALQKEYSEYFQ